ncbi:hypothetical protein MTO96_034888 [Rhipicephalus appendiculatus]
MPRKCNPITLAYRCTPSLWSGVLMFLYLMAANRCVVFFSSCSFTLKEHLMPRKCNPKGYFRLWRDKDLDEFLRLYREKMQKRKEFFHRTSRNRIMQIIKRFPHVDRSLLREMYPDVDVDKLEKIMQEKIYTAYEQQTT